MIAFIQLVEGGRWFQVEEVNALNTILRANSHLFASVRVGDWIYDFRLKQLGFPPIRRRFSTNDN